MQVHEPGSRPSTQGPDHLFTGVVWIDYLHQPTAPSRAQVQHVTFEPGARTVWHTHPLGQLLLVTSGRGRVQSAGGEVREVRPGDVISIPPGEKHWHGATPEHVMSFVAVQEELDGRVVDALEPVSDEEYSSLPVGPAERPVGPAR